MTSELDHLMNKLREGMSLSASDIDRIIEDQIKRLALYNSGVKPKKADQEKIDVGDQMKKIIAAIAPSKPKAAFKRRI